MKDDFETRSNYVASSELEFVNSWKDSPLCGDTSLALDPCSLNTFRRAWAERKCGIINSPTFAACHSQVSTTSGCTACNGSQHSPGQGQALRAHSHRCTTCPTTRLVYKMHVAATPLGTASAYVTRWRPMLRPAWTRACVWTGGPRTSAVSAPPLPQSSLEAGLSLVVVAHVQAL